MSQHYSNPAHEVDPYKLPDVEVFSLSHGEAMAINRDNGRRDTDNSGWITAGWYYHICYPGCLPDADPVGPFDTEADALADARVAMDDTET